MRLLTAVLLVLSANAALASSEDAWEAFRADVRSACAALVQDQGTVTIEVNPFGSEHFGAAIVTVQGDGLADRMICIYDKGRQTAELSAPFAE